MEHLLTRYPEASINDSRIMNTPEKNLVKKYYSTKREREAMLGTAAQFLTIKYDEKNKQYIPAVDQRYNREVEAWCFHGLEIAKREEDLLSRIDQISGKFQMDIRGLHEEKASIERQIEKLAMFPTEQEEMRKKHLAIVKEIEEYKKILPEGI